MRALIVEDESAALQNLRSILEGMQPSISVVAVAESVVESVEFLQNSASSIDLIFMDIHLADGDAFKIFERVEVTVPIIFTTAYDEYALQAFKVSSVDYLLKPIKSSEVQRALSKLQQLTTVQQQEYSARVRQVAQSSREQSARSFLIHVKDKIIPLKVEDIAYFYTSNEKVVAITLRGESYPLDRSLDNIFSILEPSVFFRANRQFIVSRVAISDISVWFGSRLSLNLCCEIPEKIIIPKARTAEFKEWLQLQG
ncbi:MAG: LytTR family DNA-binding domain-containing protein [Rikenellaceae bacterium]